MLPDKILYNNNSFNINSKEFIRRKEIDYIVMNEQEMTASVARSVTARDYEQKYATEKNFTKRKRPVQRKKQVSIDDRANETTNKIMVVEYDSKSMQRSQSNAELISNKEMMESKY